MSSKTIASGFFSALDNAALGYPVAWPGVEFTPPATGIWLEPSVLPNRPIDQGIADSASAVPQGICQVIAWSRPGSGVLDAMDVAEQVIDAFPKGTAIGEARVNRTPWISSIPLDETRIGTMVSVSYSA